ncbi:hypothetical protein LTR36_001678 [Oleoguttula mirabilis]|uniref:FAD dependent oxidoreductase domain-containing protein n=1 Tax=Oleoguttula mirabilis TaxID=1507867 RepID=A0AAV9JPK2_9PEZI|nr:hypothetical protein LTR36_001678 [Oleoguttula mirabilis]
MKNMPMELGGSGGRANSSGDVAQILPVPNATIPYWRTQLHWIDEYRSTEELPARCDVAIIGGGMSGVTLAYHLYEQASATGQAPPSIVLLEARQVCSGATGRNGGHCKVKSTTLSRMTERDGAEVAEEYAAFVQDQVYAMKHVVETEDLDCEFELRRSFDVVSVTAKKLSKSKRDFEPISSKAGGGRDTSISWVTSIKDAKVALSVPICSFWPYKFVSQLLARIVERSPINVQTNTLVTGVTDDKSGCSVLHTARGTIKARKVVFATNGYTAGICSTYNGKIVPTKGTAVHITPRPEPVAPHLSHTYNINYTPGPGRVDYLNPRPDGGIVVGGGNWTYAHDRSQWDGNFDDSTLLPSVQPHFAGLMQRHFKGWEDSGAQIDGIWTGIQGYTADEHPHVGEVPGKEGRQWVMAGYNGGGMAMIFLCAQGLAKMVVDGSRYEKTGLPMMFKTSTSRL